MNDSFSAFIGRLVGITYADGTSTMNTGTQEHRLKGANSFGVFIGFTGANMTGLQFIPWAAIRHIGLDPRALEDKEKQRVESAKRDRAEEDARRSQQSDDEE